MELLKICNEEFPSIVFVMLTNLQEFDLARDAIRYRAADYLLKVQLEAPALEESLQKAKNEYERRSKLAEADRMHFYEMCIRDRKPHKGKRWRSGKFPFLSVSGSEESPGQGMRTWKRIQ